MSDIWNDEVDGVLRLPDDWREEATLIAAAERSTPLELIKRRVELAHDSTALRKEMRRLSRLLVERVSRPGGDWLTVDEAGQRLHMTRRAIYCELHEHPTGPLATASTRLGRRIRFSKDGIDALMRTNGGLSSRRRGVLVPASGVPSRKGV